MTKHTKTTALISSLYCGGVMVLLVGAVVVVYQQKAEYHALATTLAEQAAKESSSRSIARVLEVSESDRTRLAAAFLSEQDTIAFITRVETIARQAGVVLATKDITVVPKTETLPARLRLVFAADGTYEAVTLFIRAVESLPYHIQLPTLSFRQQEAGEWQGTVEVLVTQTP